MEYTITITVDPTNTAEVLSAIQRLSALALEAHESSIGYVHPPIYALRVDEKV